MQGIEGADCLIQIFGAWPSFHNAEIVRIVLDRSGPDGPSLAAAIHVFEVLQELDAEGCFVRRNHTLVTLRFTEIALESPRWFNDQNVLWDLEISEIDPRQNEGRRFRVEMPSSHGCEVSIECERVIVEDARPYEATGAE